MDTKKQKLLKTLGWICEAVNDGVLKMLYVEYLFRAAGASLQKGAWARAEIEVFWGEMGEALRLIAATVYQSGPPIEIKVPACGQVWDNGRKLAFPQTRGPTDYFRYGDREIPLVCLDILRLLQQLPYHSLRACCAPGCVKLFVATREDNVYCGSLCRSRAATVLSKGDN